MQLPPSFQCLISSPFQSTRIFYLFALVSTNMPRPKYSATVAKPSVELSSCFMNFSCCPTPWRIDSLTSSTLRDAKCPAHSDIANPTRESKNNQRQYNRRTHTQSQHPPTRPHARVRTAYSRRSTWGSVYPSRSDTAGETSGRTESAPPAARSPTCTSDTWAR